jgi:hypothetical protein
VRYAYILVEATDAASVSQGIRGRLLPSANITTKAVIRQHNHWPTLECQEIVLAMINTLATLPPFRPSVSLRRASRFSSGHVTFYHMVSPFTQEQNHVVN